MSDLTEMFDELYLQRPDARAAVARMSERTGLDRLTVARALVRSAAEVEHPLPSQIVAIAKGSDRRGRRPRTGSHPVKQSQ